MSSSEDVLLQVNEVRYKKGDGTLYAMNERLAWILEGKDTVSVSHRYADIKSMCKQLLLLNYIMPQQSEMSSLFFKLQLKKFHLLVNRRYSCK